MKASPRTIRVPEDYPTIQEAMNTANLGNTIFQHVANTSSTNLETLTPHDPIHIGSNSDFTAENGVTRGSGTAEDPYIIENWYINVTENSGIEIKDTNAHFVIKNVLIQGNTSNLHGIWFTNVVEGTVKNSQIINNGGNGIYLRESHRNTIRECIISNNGHVPIGIFGEEHGSGIKISDGYSNQIVQNTIESNLGAGIDLWAYILYECNTTISNNKINSNGFGICTSALNNCIEFNEITSNHEDGIICGGRQQQIIGNNISENGDDGIDLSGDGGNLICLNWITSNGYDCFGLDVWSYGNLIYNNYLDNHHNAVDTAGNYWSIEKTPTEYGNIIGGSFLGGNYWSDYTGVDEDDDGLGDTPYEIPNPMPMQEWNKDYLPLVMPNQPIAQLSVSQTTIVEDIEEVRFDASASYDPDGSVVSYWYDYGDESNSGWISESVHFRSYPEPGEYYGKVKVKDNDGLESDWSLTIKITVLSKTPEPDFTISVLPASRIVSPGDSTTYTGTVMSLNGFESPVSLSLSGLPNGATYTFDPNAVTPPGDGSTQSTLTISTESTVIPDTYTLTITGSSGEITHSTSVTLIVLEYLELIEEYFPYWNFSSGEKWYPRSFYFDGDVDVENNSENYEGGILYTPFVYINIIVEPENLAIQYWLYYVWSDWASFVDDHEHDWDSVVSVIFDKDDLSRPMNVSFWHHFWIDYEDWEEVERKDNKHVVAYVANGSHGAYSTPPDGSWKYNFDKWSAGGKALGPDDFSWLIVLEDVGHKSFKVGNEDRIFCEISYVTRGVEHPDPLDGYWPREFTGDGLPLAKEPPWHRDEWIETMPTGWPDLAVIGTHSPVDLHIYDPLGRHVGKNYDTQSIEIQIPNATYHRGRDGELVTIPNPMKGEYRIEIVGTEPGTFSLVMFRITDDAVVYWEEYTNLDTQEGELQSYTTTFEESIFWWQLYWYILVAIGLVFLILGATLVIRKRMHLKMKSQSILRESKKTGSNQD